jgi:ribose/xylose/arabinose/galactoside ABC-type transport system permease subunit
MDEDEAKNKDRILSLMQLLRESPTLIAPDNKITDPPRKLSEQGLIVYKAMFDQLDSIKKQQWTITNYAALLYGAIFVFAKGLSRESYGETVLLTTMTAAVCWFGTAMLLHTQTDLNDARRQLEHANKELFKDTKERNILGFEKETEPFIRGLEFTIPLLGVIWFGAGMLMYYLINYVWSKG